MRILACLVKLHLNQLIQFFIAKNEIPISQLYFVSYISGRLYTYLVVHIFGLTYL